MLTRVLRYIGFAILLLTLLANKGTVYATPALQYEGELVTHVTWGDNGNTPATNVYAEAYGWVSIGKDNSFKSFVLKMTHAGEYRTSLPPGIYDIFISEGSSVPMCKRVLVKAGVTTEWTLKLEIDHVYNNTQR